jgi:peptidase S24-like protein
MSASESWNAQREALAVEALRASGRLRLRVHGESMLPTLWPGDMAEIESCSATKVRSGDVVLACRDGRFYLHRFLSPSERGGFLAHGDSMPGADPEFPSNSLLGKLIAASRGGQPISFRLRPWSRAVGWLFCHFALARRIALRLHTSRGPRRLMLADQDTA